MVVDVEAAEQQLQRFQPTSDGLIFISGTHVIGMSHLSLSLSETLDCPRINADQVHGVADSGASARLKAVGRRRSADTKDAFERLDDPANDRGTLYRQGVIRKLNRMGVAVRDVANFPKPMHSPVAEKKQAKEDDTVGNSGHMQQNAVAMQSASNAGTANTSAEPGRLLIIDFPAHREWHRDALRSKLQIDPGEGYRPPRPLKILFVLLLISQDLLRHRFLGAETDELAEYNFAEKVGNIQIPDADEGDDVVVVNAEDSVENQLSHILQAVRERFTS